MVAVSSYEAMLHKNSLSSSPTNIGLKHTLFFSVFETANAADDCYKQLTFEITDTTVCHNYSIPDDDDFEINATENSFKVRLSVIPTDLIVTLPSANLSVATVFINDTGEPECSELQDY